MTAPLLSRLRASGPTWLAIGLLGTLSPWLSRALDGTSELGGLVDLGTHWQLVWLPVSLTGLLLIGLNRGWRRTLIPATLAMIGVASTVCSVAPSRLPSAPESSNPAVTVASANLLYGTANLPLLREWLAHINADLVVLQEVTPGAAVKLTDWFEYPYRAMLPRDDGFGIAVLSRSPSAHTRWGVSFGAPFAIVSTELNGQPLTFYGIHPPPPARPSWHQLRNSLLAHLQDETAATSAIVAGDFNATPWSAAMPTASLQRATGLIPSWRGILPIDHVMATSDWRVIVAGRGPDTGSDHRPVWARLSR